MQAAKDSRYTAKSIDCRHFINGEFLNPNQSKTFDNINPATEEKLGWVAEGGKRR